MNNKTKISLLIVVLNVESAMLGVMKAQTSYTLQQCKAIALKNNAAMISADNQISQAEETKKEAFTKYFPTVSAMGWGVKSNHGLLKAEINTSSLISQETAALIPSSLASAIPSTVSMSMLDMGVGGSVVAVQPLFAGGRIINGNKLAKLGYDASLIQKEKNENDVELQTEKYYWQIITLREKRKTLETIKAMLAKIDSDVSASVKAGVVNRNDLLQVQLRENEIESGLNNIDNGIDVCKLLLAQYMGIAGDKQGVDNNGSFNVIGEVDMDASVNVPLSLKQDHQSALHNTPEYRLLQKNVESKALDRKMEVGCYMPSVAVGAGYASMHLLDVTNNVGVVFCTVSVPISDWWGGSHAIRRKKLAEQDAQEQLRSNSELLVIRMQKDWDDVDNACKQLVIAKKSIEQSKENLRLNNAYYKAGTTTMTDFLDAQQLFQQACDKYVDAFADMENKVLEYKQSVGLK